MEDKILITEVITKKEGVILITNYPSKLKDTNIRSKEHYVSWDKIGKALLEDYCDNYDVAELRKLRGEI